MKSFITLSEREAVVACILAAITEAFCVLFWLFTNTLLEFCLKALNSAIGIGWFAVKSKRYRALTCHKNLAILLEEAFCTVVLLMPVALLFYGFFDEPSLRPNWLEIIWWFGGTAIALSLFERRLTPRQAQLERNVALVESGN